MDFLELRHGEFLRGIRLETVALEILQVALLGRHGDPGRLA
jgi:hypothetical protein